MDPVINKQNGGVHAINQLPLSVNNVPRAYIINSQESSNTYNGHWICVYYDGHNFEFFDSFGKPPDYYSRFLTRFLESNDTEYQMNTKRLQADSSAVCGHYCLYYCYYRCRGKTMADILKEAFTKDLYSNDLYVYDFIRTHFNSYYKQ